MILLNISRGSAGFAVSAGTGLADTIGLLKEMKDADGGSGFSFMDISADRTGDRLAEMVVAKQTIGHASPGKLSPGVSESDFIAEFRDMPELYSPGSV